MIALFAAFSLLIAAPPQVPFRVLTGRAVDRTSAIDAFEALRAGDAGPADALTSRPFHIESPVAATDWSYDPGLRVLTYRPTPKFWTGSATQALSGAMGLRIGERANGEVLALALAPGVFDWLMGGEGLTAVRLPMTPETEASAAGSMRLMIDGVFAPLVGRHPAVCGALGEGCILGARIDDLVLVYGPASAPHVLARWDAATGA